MIIKGIGGPKIRRITIDDIDQFAAVKNVSLQDANLLCDRLPEEEVKRAINSLLRESHESKDWPGETSDIFSSRLSIRGERFFAAFALKGPAQKGTLVPGKMGKKGDQIQRLFQSPAQVHFVQCEERIDEGVVYQMQQLSIAKSLLGQEILYGIIDDVDTRRLRLAYSEVFARVPG